MFPFILVAGALVGLASAAVDFNRDIRPILSENCGHCHGPDAESRKAKLRLDTFEGATASRDGVQAIAPGDLMQSEAWHRILSTDPDEQMPPPDDHRQVSPAQRELLREWILSGAEYEAHWAFVAPDASAGLDVDARIEAERKTRKLAAAPPAAPRTLLRRLSLDLIGLPPSMEALAAFEADPSASAYEAAVDRLLASERFGERWARPWLDLARYADSNGFQADQLRDSWAYRDWVISALNKNMPFDQFTIEQLAGDLLPDATVDQRIATGFHRTVPCNVEAGVHPEENRYNQVVDRVNVTATAWLGLTLECAQCHDHKYDPLSMKEYYEFFAFFNNTPVEVQNLSGKGVSFDFYGPKMDLPVDSNTSKRLSALQDKVAAARKKLTEAEALSQAGFTNWLAAAQAPVPKEDAWQLLVVSQFKSTGGETSETQADGSVLLSGKVPDKTVYTIDLLAPDRPIRHIRLDAMTDSRLPGMGPGRGDPVRNNFILSEITVEVDEGKGTFRPIPIKSVVADFQQSGWSAASAFDGNRKTGWAISPELSKPHWADFCLAETLQPASVHRLRVTLDQQYGRGRVLGRVKLSARRHSATNPGVPAKLVEILAKPEATWTAGERKQVLAAYEATQPKVKRAVDALAAANKAVAKLKPPSTLVMVEMETPRETLMVKRGNYLDPMTPVAAGTPAVLHPFAADAPRNRLGLARWLVDPANPLVARVTVNRWWAELFGAGLVTTPEDFGTQSEPPSHPELLDELATELVRSGWDMKHVLKKMVLSETYKQDSRHRPELDETDPDNRFLARGPRFRMDAEMIRDNALAASGLLSTQMFGSPVMPYQPSGIWRQVGRNEPKWIEAQDLNRWRRAVYIVYRRAAPYPSMVNFDAPDRGSCTVKRPRTNTPLQALTLMNDPAYTEMALALADRVLREGPDSEAGRIDYAFRCALGRAAQADEHAIIQAVLADPVADPTALVESVKGAYKPAIKDLPLLAAWFKVTNALMNLDEMVTKE